MLTIYIMRCWVELGAHEDILYTDIHSSDTHHHGDTSKEVHTCFIYASWRMPQGLDGASTCWIFADKTPLKWVMKLHATLYILASYSLHPAQACVALRKIFTDALFCGTPCWLWLLLVCSTSQEEVKMEQRESEGKEGQDKSWDRKETYTTFGERKTERIATHAQSTKKATKESKGKYDTQTFV